MDGVLKWRAGALKQGQSQKCYRFWPNTDKILSSRENTPEMEQPS